MADYLYRFLNYFIIYDADSEDSYQHFCVTILENFPTPEKHKDLYEKIYTFLPEVEEHESRIARIYYLDGKDLYDLYQIVKEYLDVLPLDTMYQLIGNLIEVFKHEKDLGTHVTELLISLRRHEGIKSFVKIKLFSEAGRIIEEYLFSSRIFK